jgi:2-oxoglutarate ferredoxin oxidoreductase subunit alpha
VEEVSAILKQAKTTVLVEENYNGQLGDLIRTQTGITLDKRVVKFDGRPFSEEELVEGVKTALASSETRIPVTHYLP